jgi:hypothetical protein
MTTRFIGDFTCSSSGEEVNKNVSEARTTIWIHESLWKDSILL